MNYAWELNFYSGNGYTLRANLSIKKVSKNYDIRGSLIDAKWIWIDILIS